MCFASGISSQNSRPSHDPIPFAHANIRGQQFLPVNISGFPSGEVWVATVNLAALCIEKI
jgi:hypothetical protein